MCTMRARFDFGILGQSVKVASRRKNGGDWIEKLVERAFGRRGRWDWREPLSSKLLWLMTPADLRASTLLKYKELLV